MPYIVDCWPFLVWPASGRFWLAVQPDMVLIDQTKSWGRYITWRFIAMTSHDCHGVSNHRQLDCLFDSSFQVATNNASMLCIFGPLLREFTCDWWIPYRMRQWCEMCFYGMTSLCHKDLQPCTYSMWRVANTYVHLCYSSTVGPLRLFRLTIHGPLFQTCVNFPA